MPRTTTESALLAAVAATPDDDLPRLVYADWCDENGQSERAEFIRTEIEMARLATYGHTIAVLRQRAQELWEAHREKWYPGLVNYREQCDTRRGFPHEIRLTGRAFRDRGERMFRLAPTLHSVMLEDIHEATVSLARCQTLGQVRQLIPYFRGHDPSPDAAVALFRTKHLGGLRSLILLGEIGPAGVSAVADCPSLTRLEDLSLRAQFVGDGSVIYLIRQAKFHTLHMFGGSLNRLTDEFAGALASADHLDKIRHLDLSNNQITAIGVARLCAAAHLGRLERLDLSTNSLGTDAGTSLAAARFAGTLRMLAVQKCEMGRDGTARLLAARFPLLEELHVTDNLVSVVGVRALAGNGGLGSLAKLVLNGCRLSPAAVSVLAGATSLTALRELHLGYQPLSDPTVRTLVGGPLVGLLDTLGINDARMTDTGAEAIAAADLPNLRVLSLVSNRLTESGVRALVQSKTLGGLRVLNISGMKMNENRRAALRAMLRERFGPDGGFV